MPAQNSAIETALKDTVLFKDLKGITLDTTELIRQYNRNGAFQNSFRNILNNPNGVYLGRPVAVYLRLIGTIDTRYKNLAFGEITPELIDKTLKRLWERGGYIKIDGFYRDLVADNTNSKMALSQDDEQFLEELKKAEEEKDPKKKQKAYEKVKTLKGSSSKEEKKEETKELASTNDQLPITKNPIPEVPSLVNPQGHPLSLQSPKPPLSPKPSGLVDSRGKPLSTPPIPQSSIIYGSPGRYLKTVTQKVSNKLESTGVTSKAKDVSSLVQRSMGSWIRRHPLLFATLMGGVGGFVVGFIFTSSIPVATTIAMAGAATPQVVSKIDKQGAATEPQPEQSSSDRSGGGHPLPTRFGRPGRINPAQTAAIAKRIAQIRKAITIARSAALLANPWVLGTIAVVLVLLIVIPILFMILQSTSFLVGETDGPGLSDNRVEISKKGPAQVPNGADIVYELQVKYTGSGQADVTVTDTVPQNTTFKEASDNGKNENGTVKWTLTGLSSGQSRKITLTVTPSKNDIWVVNNANVKIDRITGGSKGGSCPSQEIINNNKKDRNTCHYLNPAIDLFDTNISSSAVESYITKYSPTFTRADKGDLNEFKRRVNLIVSTAKAQGLNPVLFLGYWKTESAFSTVGNRDFGCIGNGFEAQLDCAVGKGLGSTVAAQCAVSKDANSTSCKTVKGIRDSHPQIYGKYPITLPIATIDDFAEVYGPIAPNLGDAAQNNNCIHTYNTLLEVANELNGCKALSTGENNPILSADGKYSCPAKEKYVPFTSYKNLKQNEFSYACGHARPIFNAIDFGTYPGGGTEALAIVDGDVRNYSSANSGPSLLLTADNGISYFYGHLKSEELVTGRVKAGQKIGYIAGDHENATARNNGTAHIHFSAATDPFKHRLDNPSDIPAGKLLDQLCGINVCKGQNNAIY